MIGSSELADSSGKEFQLPQRWQDQIVSEFEQLESTPFPESGAYGKDPNIWRDRSLPKYAALLRVLTSTSVHPSTSARMAELLLKKLKLALRPSTSPPTEETLFLVTDGFAAYLSMSTLAGFFDATLSPLLQAAAPRFSRLTGFLDSLRAHEKEASKRRGGDSQRSHTSESSQAEEDLFVKALTANLSASSPRLRSSSLDILSRLDGQPDPLAVLAIMLQTEQTPLDLANARNIGVHLRKLSQSYSHLKGSWLQEAVPAFLFGMLTVPLSPVWDDAIEALTRVSEVKAGEEAIAQLAFEWLEEPSARWNAQARPVVNPSHAPLTDFECLHLGKLLRAAQAINQTMETSNEVLLQAYRSAQEAVPPHPTTARSRALKVLSAIPALAERRSRRLVPHLLSWTTGESEPTEEDDEMTWSQARTWSLGDKKALIGVFSQFVNPRALYQPDKVYGVFLGLLANGDVEIQKLALKALLGWKQAGVKSYKENLENLLDESKFKNELTNLLHDEQLVKPEHRGELMPVLLRLLYGRTISKKGAASGRHGLHATRQSVIRSLSVEDTGAFLQIALGRLKDVKMVDAAGFHEAVLSQNVVPVRTQVGLLNMLESVINELGPRVDSFAEPLVNAVLYCLVSACRGLQGTTDEVTEEKSEVSLRKVVRTTSLKCLCSLFRNAAAFDWTPYQDALVAEAISPNIERLPLETTQGVSWTWRLLSTWASLPKAAVFLAVDSRTLPKMIECLSVAKAKDEVKIFALGVVRSLVQTARAADSPEGDLVRTQLLSPNLDGILGRIDGVLRSQSELPRNLLEACVETVVELSPLVDKSDNIRSLVDISAFLLNQPSRKVNPKVKGSLLLILERFIVLDDLQGDSELKQNVFSTVSSLFGFFKDRENRQSLGRVLRVFASQEQSLQEVASLCADLNSYIELRIDEPDYDRRLVAFHAISAERELPFTSEQWTPLLHNLVYFLRREEEFGILTTNSGDGLCRFIRATKAVDQTKEFTDLLADIVLPTLYSGTRDPSETVRRQVLRVMGFLAAQLPSWAPVADLAPLAEDSDTDSDRAFFFNILSPAVSKQLRAMQILESDNQRSEFHSRTISQFFLPLLEHFIFEREEGADDHGLGAQATNTIASLTASLEWSQYRAVLRRFLSFVESKPNLQKRVIRLLDKVIDTLGHAAQSRGHAESALPSASSKQRLVKTLPDPQKLSDEVTANMLPSLLEQLHEKDEATVSARVPVGIVVVKLLNILPVQERDRRLPGVLTDICHILRSKATESRDMARETLAQASRILGPGCFGFVLKELRGALTRGYQLHVLSYTVHSLLLAVIPEFPQGDLDYCLPDLVAVIMDDIFGVTGQEKDAEEYTSQMKEIKSSKSQDSMELIAKNASVSRLGDLIRPLRSLLLEKLNTRMVRKIDDLLSRITTGLLQNSASESRDTLVFCYEVIQETYKKQETVAEPKIDRRLRRYLVYKDAKKESGATRRSTHKLVRFAIDVVRSVLRKHDSLRNAGNITGFLPPLGDAIVGGEEEVRMAAFKLLTVIVKVPFKTNQATNLYKVAVKEAAKTITMSPTTATDAAQSALKFVSVVLRDRREVAVKDAAIDVLLGKLKDDLTEPLYRHVTFNFLRSVLDRRVETAVVYDTLDYVGAVMITNEDKDTRDLARGAFFQFLRDYPQKKSRWQKQLTFIVANLKYEREGGRVSVMEVIHLLLLKSSDDFVQEVASTCFIPLVFVLANDDSEKCRLAATELLKEVFRKAGKENVRNFLTLLRSWIDQDKPAVLRLALRVFSLYFEATGEPGGQDQEMIVRKVTDLLGGGANDVELVDTALRTVQTLLETCPAAVLSPGARGLWDQIQECLFVRDGVVRLTATKLVGAFLADLAGNSQSGQQKSPRGLELEMSYTTRLVKGCVGILGAAEVEEELATESARILVFLSRQLPTLRASADSDSDSEADDEPDEDQDATSELDLQFVLRRMAAIVRKETPPKAAFLIPKLAAMDVLEALARQSAADAVAPSVRAVLRPLRNLTDPSIAAPFVHDEVFKARLDALKTKAQSVMDVLQKAFGTAEYSRHLLAVGEGMRERRMQRTSKRKIEAVAAPGRYGREKRRKGERKKERRKEKGREARDRRKAY